MSIDFIFSRRELKNIVIPASTKVDETAFEGSGVKKDETLLEKRRENDKFAEDEK